MTSHVPRPLDRLTERYFCFKPWPFFYKFSGNILLFGRLGELRNILLNFPSLPQFSQDWASKPRRSQLIENLFITNKNPGAERGQPHQSILSPFLASNTRPFVLVSFGHFLIFISCEQRPPLNLQPHHHHFLIKNQPYDLPKWNKQTNPSQHPAISSQVS